MPTSDWMNEARQMAAQCWCDENTQHIKMDPVLCEAVARRIASWMDTAAFYNRNENYWRERAQQADAPHVVDIDKLAEEVKGWADAAFPGRTDASMFLKLYSEIGELVESIDYESRDQCEDEIADIFIMMLDFAKRKGVDLAVAIHRKMEVNRGREWQLTGAGVFQHVKG